MNSKIRKQLEEILHSECDDDGEIIVNDGAAAGDGYLGNYILAEIKGAKKSLEFFIKACNGPFNKMTVVRRTFSNEICWYDKYMPALAHLQEEKNIEKPFNNYAKCYGTCKEPFEEYIILENLKAAGFELYDRTKVIDKTHLLLIMQTAANYHAVQYAFKDQQPERYNEIVGELQDALFECLQDTGFDKSIQANVETYFKTCGNEKFPALADKLRERTANTFNYSKDWKDDYSILIQGDLWCNNMMFKYENGSPVDMRIMDFQLISRNSPVCDVSLFFYTLCSKEILEDFNYYLKFYHDQLSKRLRELGSDPEKVFPYRIFKEQWKKYAIYGLSVGFLILKVMLAREDEVRSVNDVLDNGGHMSETFAFSSKSDEEFNERMTRNLQHFIDNGLI